MTSASPDAAEWRFPNRATPFGSPAYYAVRFSPLAERERNALLLAWFDTLQTIALQPHDPGVARLKLDWWRSEITALAAACPRHPLAAALHREGIGTGAAHYLQKIIDAAEQQIREPVPGDERQFAQACRDALGSLFGLLAEMDGGSQDTVARSIEHGGYCMAVQRIRQHALLARLFPPDLGAGRLRTLDERQRTQRFEELLQQFATGPQCAPPAVMPDLARRFTALHQAIHRKLLRTAYPVSDRLIDRAPIAHLWTAWRCR